jgi:hypothetical protein
MLHFGWQKMHDFIWKFRLKAPPSLTMGTLVLMRFCTPKLAATSKEI